MEKRTESFAKGDLEIAIATFAMHSDGKVPDGQVEKNRKMVTSAFEVGRTGVEGAAG